jgi:hypothetical protein
VTRPDWRTLVALAVFVGLWWYFTLAAGCRPLWPTELVPATTPVHGAEAPASPR